MFQSQKSQKYDTTCHSESSDEKSIHWYKTLGDGEVARVHLQCGNDYAPSMQENFCRGMMESVLFY